MCDHQPREAAMVTTHRDQNGTPTVWCDPCLEPLIRALNDGGLPTIASCCGHGLLPGNVILKDGRCLLLLPSYEDAAWMEEHWINGEAKRQFDGDEFERENNKDDVDLVWPPAHNDGTEER
jgi:hypothetical protein